MEAAFLDTVTSRFRSIVSATTSAVISLVVLHGSTLWSGFFAYSISSVVTLYSAADLASITGLLVFSCTAADAAVAPLAKSINAVSRIAIFLLILFKLKITFTSQFQNSVLPMVRLRSAPPEARGPLFLRFPGFLRPQRTSFVPDSALESLPPPAWE